MAEQKQLSSMNEKLVGRTIMMHWKDDVGWRLGLITSLTQETYLVEYGQLAGQLPKTNAILQLHCGEHDDYSDIGEHTGFPMKNCFAQNKKHKFGAWALLKAQPQLPKKAKRRIVAGR
tara:strand:- start:478 stop:831 length:354 start_codon:yes stop_codon:yes gene_type:complete